MVWQAVSKRSFLLAAPFRLFCIEAPPLFGTIRLSYQTSMLISPKHDLAEYFRARQEDVIHMPSHMTYEEAATLPFACGTAWSALYGRTKQVTSGDVVVCMGTGGVSFFTAAVSISCDRHFGTARRVRPVHGN